MDDSSAASQYTSGTLEQTILTALQQSGKNLDTLTITDLAPLDQFHFGGRPAVLAQARLAGVKPGMAVLDVGGGIGGPARTLASEYGSHVTVLDVTEEFCQVGERLTRMVGLSDRVTFHHGDALAMPFDDASFDLAWTEHSTMNIPDKERLFREIHRVLRPGGIYALHEAMTGPNQPLHFPAPWARRPEASFVATPEEYQRLLSAAGFRQIAWEASPPAPPGQGPTPAGEKPLPGINILGPDMPERLRNGMRNQTEGRIIVMQGVFERV